MTTVMLSVGDASGDAITADFVDELRVLRPGVRFAGLAGPRLAERGVECIVDQRELAVGGLVELAPSARRLARAWRTITAAIPRLRPSLAVLVDSSGFNLPLARRFRRAGVPTLYYVSPQVWAWRAGRIHKLSRRVDRMAAILPFEPDVFAGSGLAVDFVGHPLVDRLAPHLGPWDRATARRRLGLPAGAAVIALLPCSRRSEISNGVDLMARVARLLHARKPEARFILPVAPSLERSELESALGRAGAGTPPIALVDGASPHALAACDAALLKPGTAVLEAALLDRPAVVAGRVHPLTAAIARPLLRVDSVAMPNLIAGRRVVPEFLQESARPEWIADAMLGVLTGPGRSTQLAGLAEVRRALGPGGAARRTAAIAQEMLGASARE